MQNVRGLRIGLHLVRWCVVGVLLLGMAVTAKAEITETRDYLVYVDGKQVGTNQRVITEHDNGFVTVTSSVDVKVKILITYRYSYRGTEVYKGYQLHKLESNCQDFKTLYTAAAYLTKDGQNLVISNKTKQVVGPADAWSTTFWKLPDRKYFNKNIQLLDTEHGALLPSKLVYVGKEGMDMNGKKQTVFHFRVFKKSQPVDLWFDVQHRLVRLELTERRHRTVIQMVNVRRK
ncbi:MAG: DUF6134 family protein [Gemmataceae bacterium]